MFEKREPPRPVFNSTVLNSGTSAPKEHVLHHVKYDATNGTPGIEYARTVGHRLHARCPAYYYGEISTVAALPNGMDFSSPTISSLEEMPEEVTRPSPLITLITEKATAAQKPPVRPHYLQRFVLRRFRTRHRLKDISVRVLEDLGSTLQYCRP